MEPHWVWDRVPARARRLNVLLHIEMVHVVSSAENRKLIALYLSRNFVLMDINTQGKNVPNCTLIVHVMMS